MSSLLASERISCSELIVNLDLVRSEVFFIAFEKIYSRFGFRLRSFRLVCCLDMRSFVWIWTISVSLLNIGKSNELHVLDMGTQ